jgi:hypothetical protein
MSAKAFQLNPDCRLVLLRDQAAAAVNSLPKLMTVIQDWSGSMGNAANYCVDAIKKAASSAGVKDVNLILFGLNVTVRQDVPVASLTRAMFHELEGGTIMDKVPEALKVQLLREASDHVLFVMSDGDVSNLPVALANLDLMKAEISKMELPPVSVCGIRVVTNSQATPDTQAVAAFSMLHTGPGTSRLEDVRVYDLKKEDAVMALESSMTDALNEFTGACVTVTTADGSKALRRMPHDKPVASLKMVVPATLDACLLVDNGVKLCVDGVELAEIVEPLQESRVDRFLTIVLAWLRKAIVAGSGDVDGVIAFIESIQFPQQPPAAVAVDVPKTAVHARMKELCTRLGLEKQAAKSLLTQITELRAGARIKMFASQQEKADFMRGNVSGTRGYAGLARRLVDAATPTEVAQAGLSSFRTSLFTNPDLSCFVGLSGAKDYLEIVEELLECQTDTLTAEDILTVAGGVGLALKVKKGAAPDPFMVNVDKVFIGFHMGQPELLAAHKSGGVCFPGTTDKVNGVVDLTNTCGGIAQLHAGYSIRGVICPPVPGDQLALAAGAYVCLLRQAFAPFADSASKSPVHTSLPCSDFSMKHSRPLVPSPAFAGAPSEAESTALSHLFSALKNLGACIGNVILVEAMLSDDPGAGFIGENACSGDLKPLMLLLCHERLDPVRKDAQRFLRVLKAIYVFQEYILSRDLVKYRPAADTKRALHNILSVYPATEPIDPSAPDGPFSLPPRPPPSQVLMELYNQYLPLYLSLGHPVSAFEEAFSPMFRTAAFSAAIDCRGEKERVKDGRTLVDLSDDAKCSQYLDVLYEREYREDYDNRMRVKQGLKHVLEVKKLVYQLCDTPHSDKFIKLLNKHMPTREADGFSDLMYFLFEEKNMPGRRVKAWLLATGRYPENPSVPMCFGGNVYRGKEWPKFLQVVDPDAELMNAVAKTYGTYKYPRSKNNRNLHGNDFPSYFALGYATMTAMKESVSADEYAEYVAKHTNCCGFRDGTGPQKRSVS